MQRTRKLIRLLSSLILILMIVASCVPAFSEQVGGFSGTVRILLSNLNLTESLKIGVYGSYTIEDRISFQRGTELQVRLTNQGLVVFYEGMSYFPGKQLILRRHRGEEGKENGLRLQEGLNLYPGDLLISIVGNKLQAVLTIPLEEYLMGVVPYEMNDDFPLEALKAQAIAARTYTLRNLKPQQAYDMTDTTNDQVYYGLNKDKTNAIKAVQETGGKALYYENALAQCYYTASNGGWTESAFNAWGRERIPYLGIQQDRYDLENPASEVRQYKVYKRVSQDQPLNPVLQELLLKKLVSRMHALGYSENVQDIRIDEVVGIVPHTTRHGGEHGVMRFLRFDMKVSGRSYESSSDQEISFVVGEASPAPAATSGEKQLSGFRQLPQTISVDCDIFPDIERILNLSINRNTNELVHVETKEDSFLIRFTRYGHGVGLSQRGAEWMAATYGWDHEQILRFYYPGTVMKQVRSSHQLPDPIGRAYLTTPGPVPTATPRPTLMPVLKVKTSGKPVAAVNKIPVNSSLNLRAAANLNSEVLQRLFFGQELIVLQEFEDGWLLVETDVIKGYVRKEFVSLE